MCSAIIARSFLELEPQDNKRGSYNRKYINSNVKNNLDKNYNNINTIIINNNIHINTYFDKNDLSKKDLIKANFIRNNPNLIVFNQPNDKIKNEINKYKSHNKSRKIKKKNMFEAKNDDTQISKSNLLHSYRFDNTNNIHKLKGI